MQRHSQSVEVKEEEERRRRRSEDYVEDDAEILTQRSAF